MSARLRQLLAEIEGAPSMRPACERWADVIRAELAERPLPPPSAAERLRTLSEAIDRALYGQSSAGFSPAHEALAAGWLLELQSVLAELVEQGAPATDDPRLEALRLATSLRREEEAARRGVSVSGGLARLGELHKLEAILSRLALGPLADTPIEELLSVALDLAEERGEYSEALSARVAGLLPALIARKTVGDAVLALPVAGPWRTEYRNISVKRARRWSRFDMRGWWCATAIRNDHFAGWVAQHQRLDGSGAVSLGDAIPTLQEAMTAIDAAMIADGWVPLGDAPDLSKEAP